MLGRVMADPATVRTNDEAVVYDVRWMVSVAARIQDFSDCHRGGYLLSGIAADRAALDVGA
jgi:hypothetical protein